MSDYPGYKPKHYDDDGGHIDKHLKKIDEKFEEIDEKLEGGGQSSGGGVVYKQDTKIFPNLPYYNYIGWRDTYVENATKTTLVAFEFNTVAVSSAVIHFELMRMIGSFELATNPNIASVKLRIRSYDNGNVGAVVKDLGTYIPQEILSTEEFEALLPPTEREFAVNETLSGLYWIEFVLTTTDTMQGESDIAVYTTSGDGYYDDKAILVPLYTVGEEEFTMDQVIMYLYQGELPATAVENNILWAYNQNSGVPIFSPLFPFIYFKEA